MDKRLLFFVLLLSGALLAVNYYFQGQHEEELRIWKQNQQARTESRRQQLEEQIKAETIDVSTLPIQELFEDPEGKISLGTGFADGNGLITLSKAPAKLFARNSKSNDSLVPYEVKPFEFPISAHFYIRDIDEPLRIGDLPDFGRFKLQVVGFSPLVSTPASFNDGSFSLHVNELARLQEISSQEISSKDKLFNQNGIVLVKIDQEWLPVGLYNHENEQVTWLEEIPGLQTLTISPQGKVLPSKGEKALEQYYVLENRYQQLVFSNYGGALAEINLPFQDASDPASVVKEIQFDRDMVEHHPQNAHFPSHPYLVAGTDDSSITKKQQGSLGGYYPLIRRDLVQDEGRKNIKIPPRFYAFNIISEYPEVAELVYEVKNFTKNQIVFEARQSHRTITKTFQISDEEKGGPYTIDLTIQIEGDNRGLWLTSGVPEVEWISGAAAPALKYRITRHNKSAVEPLDLPKDAITISSLNPDWLSNSNGFFGLIMDPLGTGGAGLRANFVPGTLVPSRLVEIDQEYDLYPADKMPGYMMYLPLKSGSGTFHFRLFSGPLATSILQQVDATYSNPETGYNPDYISSQTYHGWFSFVSEPFAKFLFFLMKWFYALTGSWAFSIILLTIALRIMLYPLNNWSLKSTARMQEIAPEVKAIQERHKKDPQKAQMEIINLYRERGVNPLSGCLPLLIQMPFLIGMFDLLKSTFELRGASFIPGWIDDLSAPDVLFSWKYPIFFIGNAFHLLPFILGGVMFLQQRMMAGAVNVNEMTDQQRQQRAMGNMMTVVFAIMFYHFPSGLNIYWLSSMLLGILQQWWTNRQLKGKALTKGKPIKT